MIITRLKEVSSMEKCLFSKRVYKTELLTEDVFAIEDTLVIFNKAKHCAYKLLLNEHNLKYKDSVHMQIKNRYNLIVKKFLKKETRCNKSNHLILKKKNFKLIL